MELINHSPYLADMAVDMDRNGAKTWSSSSKQPRCPNGYVRTSPEQKDIEWADVYIQVTGGIKCFV